MHAQLRFWRYYAVSVTIVVAATLPFYFSIVSPPRLVDLLDYLAEAVLLAGILSFAWRKRLVSRLFWRLFLPLMLAWSLYFAYVVPMPPELLAKMGPLAQWQATSLNLILASPIYVGLYLYAYRDNDPWRQEPVA